MERPFGLWREVLVWGVCGVLVPYATWTGSYSDAPPPQQWLYAGGAAISILVGLWMACTGRLLVWRTAERGPRLGAPSAAFWSPYAAFLWVLIVVVLRILIGLVTGEPESWRPLLNALPGGTFAGCFAQLALLKSIVLVFGYHPEPSGAEAGGEHPDEHSDEGTRSSQQPL